MWKLPHLSTTSSLRHRLQHLAKSSRILTPLTAYQHKIISARYSPSSTISLRSNATTSWSSAAEPSRNIIVCNDNNITRFSFVHTHARSCCNNIRAVSTIQRNLYATISSTTGGTTTTTTRGGGYRRNIAQNDIWQEKEDPTENKGRYKPNVYVLIAFAFIVFGMHLGPLFVALDESRQNKATQELFDAIATNDEEAKRLALSTLRALAQDHYTACRLYKSDKKLMQELVRLVSSAEENNSFVRTEAMRLLLQLSKNALINYELVHSTDYLKNLCTSTTEDLAEMQQIAASLKQIASVNENHEELFKYLDAFAPLLSHRDISINSNLSSTLAALFLNDSIREKIVKYEQRNYMEYLYKLKKSHNPITRKLAYLCIAVAQGTESPQEIQRYMNKLEAVRHFSRVSTYALAGFVWPIVRMCLSRFFHSSARGRVEASTPFKAAAVMTLFGVFNAAMSFYSNHFIRHFPLDRTDEQLLRESLHQLMFTKCVSLAQPIAVAAACWKVPFLLIPWVIATNVKASWSPFVKRVSVITEKERAAVMAATTPSSTTTTTTTGQQQQQQQQQQRP